MTNKIHRQKVTVTLDENIWKELSKIKINGGYKTINEVIKVLIGGKK